MPIYEYRCPQCGEVFDHRFRTLKAAEEKGPPACPACGDSGAERLISSIAVPGGKASSSDGETGVTAADSKIFGRKELQKALKDRGY
jgi:putative FmdB family regulatory protein